MNITDMGILSPSGNYLVFGFKPTTPIEDRFVVKNLYGLDADEIVSNFLTAQNAGGGGELYDMSLKGREVVMRIVLQPDFANGETHGNLRDEIYKFIAANRNAVISLHFFEGDINNERAYLYGFITKVEVPLTQETSEVQITVQCTDPILRGPNNVEEFVSGTGFVIEDNISTAPHGFKFALRFTSHAGASYSFEIGPSPGHPEFQINIGNLLDDGDFGFRSGDILTFSSAFNTRELTIFRGNVIPIADKIEADSVWPMIFPGSNPFSFYCGPTATWTWLYFRYYHAFWGV